MEQPRLSFLATDVSLFYPYFIYTSDKEPSLFIKCSHVYRLFRHHLHGFEGYFMKFITRYNFIIIPSYLFIFKHKFKILYLMNELLGV